MLYHKWHLDYLKLPFFFHLVKLPNSQSNVTWVLSRQKRFYALFWFLTKFSRRRRSFNLYSFWNSIYFAFNNGMASTRFSPQFEKAFIQSKKSTTMNSLTFSRSRALWKATVDFQHWHRQSTRQQVDCYKINNAHCFFPNCRKHEKTNWRKRTKV